MCFQYCFFSYKKLAKLSSAFIKSCYIIIFGRFCLIIQCSVFLGDDISIAFREYGCSVARPLLVRGTNFIKHEKRIIILFVLLFFFLLHAPQLIIQCYVFLLALLNNIIVKSKYFSKRKV